MKNSSNIKKISNDLFFDQIKELLAEGQSVKINVTGRSMDPTFKDGKDVLVISPFEPDKLAVGDVVLFDRGDTICVHRIIARSGDRLVIRGDGNPKHALEPAKVSDVIGLITGGTFRGGREFTIEDEAWACQTRYVRKFYPMLCAWHKLRLILIQYPLSILTLLALTYLSFVDASTFQDVEVNISDKIVHAVMYSGLSMVFWFEWLKAHGLSKRAMLRGLVPCVLLPIVIGGLLEVGQSTLTTTRNGDVWDFVANTCGTLGMTVLMLGVAAPVVKYFKKRKRQ